jgi:hypothetical protein
MPHYHRRGAVSLLSSERDQVVHTRYGRQAILVESCGCRLATQRLKSWSTSLFQIRFRERHQHTGLINAQTAWVLYGQASRAISIR